MISNIVIIGAGSTGFSTALEIAKANTSFKVIVLEKDFAGSGQTGQCCGLVRTFYNSKEMIFSAKESLKEIKKICKSEKGIKYVKTGLLVIDSFKNEKSIKKNVKLIQKQGIDTEFLSESSLKRLYPDLNSDNVCAGLDKDAGYVNPQLIIGYLKKNCEKYGVQIFERTKVLGIQKIKERFRIKTNKGFYYADKLFNATAGYTNNINKMLGFVLPIKVISISNTFYRLPIKLHNLKFALVDFVNKFYLIPHEDFIDVSTVALNFKKEIYLEKEQSIFNQKTPDDYLRLMSERIPDISQSSKLGGFSSHLDISPDYYPILSKIDEIPNYYCATGFSGTGFKHFPMVGKIMKEIILDEKYTYPKLVKFFRYNRFKKETFREDVSDSYFFDE